MNIISTQNPLIKQIIALREAKGRRETGLMLIDGLPQIQRAMVAGVKIEKIIHKLGTPTITGIKNVEMVEVSAKVIEKLAYGQKGDDVIAVAKVSPRKLADLKLPPTPLVVVLESVEKPGNLGAVLRTCDGAGVDALLISDPKTDIYNPNVIRSSIGTIFTVPTVIGTNEEISTFLKKHQLKTFGAFPDAAQIYAEADFKGPLAIILGTEDQGLSEFWRKQCQHKVKIPMRGRVDSLNVSVSAAVIIYEALRQRTYHTIANNSGTGRSGGR